MSSVMIRVVCSIIKVGHSKLAVVDHIPRVVLGLHGVIKLLTTECVVFLLFFDNLDLHRLDVALSVVRDMPSTSLTLLTPGTWGTTLVGILTDILLPLCTFCPGQTTPILTGPWVTIGVLTSAIDQHDLPKSLLFLCLFFLLFLSFLPFLSFLTFFSLFAFGSFLVISVTFFGGFITFFSLCLDGVELLSRLFINLLHLGEDLRRLPAGIIT